jgi:hypothetical protein
VGERRQVPGRVTARESPEHRRVQRLDSVQRESDVAGETERVPVGLINRHPGELPGILGRPLAQRGRLPVSSRRSHQYQRDALRRRGESFQQPGTRDQTVPVDRALNLPLHRDERKL